MGVLELLATWVSSFIIIFFLIALILLNILKFGLLNSWTSIRTYKYIIICVNVYIRTVGMAYLMQGVLGFFVTDGDNH